MPSTRRSTCSTICCTTLRARTTAAAALRRCAHRSSCPNCCPSTIRSSRSARASRRPASSSCTPWRPRSRRISSKVKDVLDIFVRRGGGRIEELTPQLELLKKIGDTLGVLGLGELRQRVQQETAALEASSRAPLPRRTALVQVAGVLLIGRGSAGRSAGRLILPRRTEARGGSRDASGPCRLPAGQEAVLRECVVNLARIKEAFRWRQKSADFDAAGFDNWPELMRGINAGLLMLGKGSAVEMIEAITCTCGR